MHLMGNELTRITHDLKLTTDRAEKKECLFLANDLADLYVHYIFEPTYSEYRGKPQTWSTFTDEIARTEAGIKDDRLRRIIERRPPLGDDEIDAELAKCYHSIQHKFCVNIRELRALKRERAMIAHTRCKSAVEQQQLLEKARETRLPSDFEYKAVFYNMIQELDALNEKFHRML